MHIFISIFFIKKIATQNFIFFELKNILNRNTPLATQLSNGSKQASN
jgi:hypothetical protein